MAPRFVRLRLPWHQRPRVLSEAQVRQLISATRTPRERALIEFFYSTGCRLNEARHIKIENIDFVARQARVRGKLRKLRLVLLAESASTAVRNYIGNRTIGYGLRRMLLAPARKPKQILEVGERKSIPSERVTLVLGSPSEVECVRTIFNMFVTEKRSVADIARELNRRDIKNFSGRAWEYQGVNNILMHPKYAGFNVYNRTTRKKLLHANAFTYFPRIGADTRARITVREPWLKSGIRVTDLARVCEAFEKVRSAAT